jgi:hypothetical protein
MLAYGISLLIWAPHQLQYHHCHSALPSQTFCISAIFGQKTGLAFRPDIVIHSGLSRSKHIIVFSEPYCIVPRDFRFLDLLKVSSRLFLP